MSASILVVGATGRIGSELVRTLLAHAAPVRALLRTPAMVEALTTAGVEVVAGDLEDKASLDRAVHGIERVFLLSPPHPRQVELQGNLVEAAQRGGVQHIVKLSALGASPDWPLTVPRWHWHTEQQIERSGLDFTHLRPNHFMQMIVTLAAEAIQHGTLSVLAGAGRVSMVDARDIASVAACTLLESGHEGKVNEITGPEALSFSDVAEQLTAATGCPISFVARSRLADLMAIGLPIWWAEYCVGVYGLYREAGPLGWAASVTNVVAEVGRRRPRTFAEFAREFRDVFVDVR